MQGYYLEIKITKVFHVTLVDPEQKRKLLECIKLDLLSCDCEGVYDRIESNVKHLMDNVLPL